MLCLPSQTTTEANRLAIRLAPLLGTAAAILFNLAAPAVRPGYVEMVLGAMRGSGTFVGEWDIGSDLLADIDEGLARLGDAAHEIR